MVIIKKYLKIIIPIVTALAIIAILFATGVLSGGIKQTSKDIELGSTVNLMTLVEYDKGKYSVSVSDDGDIDTSKVGNYKVTYIIKNSKTGNSKEKEYTFAVKDTISPVITSVKTDITLEHDAEFKIKDYVKYSDKSGKCTVSYSGEVNTEKAGKYEVTAIVEDKSGNASEVDGIHVTVKKRGKPDVRKAKFGDSLKVVKKYETLSDGEYVKEERTLYYETELDGLSARLLYEFNKKGQLCVVAYMIDEDYLNWDRYVADFKSLKKKLIKKYGQPDETVENKGSLYGYCTSQGEALQLGQYETQVRWYKKNMKIHLTLREGNYDAPVFGIAYISTHYKMDDNSNEF